MSKPSTAINLPGLISCLFVYCSPSRSKQRQTSSSPHSFHNFVYIVRVHDAQRAHIFHPEANKIAHFITGLIVSYIQNEHVGAGIYNLNIFVINDKMLGIYLQIANIKNSAVRGFSVIFLINLNSFTLRIHSDITGRYFRFLRNLDDLRIQFEHVIVHTFNRSISEQIFTKEKSFSHPKVVDADGQLITQQQGNGYGGSARNQRNRFIKLKLYDLLI